VGKPAPIEATCYTELEQYKQEIWPSKFPALPQVGDKIVSRTGKALVVRSREFTDMNDRGFSHADKTSITKIRLELSH